MSRDGVGLWGPHDLVRMRPIKCLQGTGNHLQKYFRVADHAQKNFFNGGALSPQTVRDTVLRRKNEIDRAVVAESARWGDAKVSTPLTRNTNWLAEVQRILTSYIPQRGNIVLGQLRGDQLWPTVVAPTFGKFGGTVAPGFALTMSRPASPAGTKLSLTIWPLM